MTVWDVTHCDCNVYLVYKLQTGVIKSILSSLNKPQNPGATRSDLRRKAAQSFVRSKLLQLQITHLCSSSATHFSMQHQVQQQVISEGRQHKVSSEANCFSCKLPICALHQRHITPCSNDPSTPSTFTLASLHNAMQRQAQHEVISEGRQHKVSSEANCFSCKLPICARHQRHITACSTKCNSKWSQKEGSTKFRQKQIASAANYPCVLFISDTLHTMLQWPKHTKHVHSCFTAQCHAAPSATRSDLRRKAAQSFVRSKLLQLQIIHVCSSSATHYSMQHQVQQEVISEGRQHKVSSEANCFSCKLPICALHQRHITACSTKCNSKWSQKEGSTKFRQKQNASAANYPFVLFISDTLHHAPMTQTHQARSLLLHCTMPCSTKGNNKQPNMANTCPKITTPVDIPCLIYWNRYSIRNLIVFHQPCINHNLSFGGFFL